MPTLSLQTRIDRVPNAGAVLDLYQGRMVLDEPLIMPPNKSVYLRGRAEALTRLEFTPKAMRDNPQGLIVWPPGDRGSTPCGGVSDLSVKCQQPDSSELTDMLHYPPVFMVSGQCKPVFRNIYVVAAWDGWQIGSEIVGVNGAVLDHCGGSWFNTLVHAVTSWDAVRVDDLHGWVHEFTNKQYLAFSKAPTVAMKCGSVAGFHVNSPNCMTLGAALHTYESIQDLGPKVIMQGGWYDAYGDIVVDGGDVSMTNFHGSGVWKCRKGVLHINTATWVHGLQQYIGEHTGGIMSVSDVKVDSVTGSVPLIYTNDRWSLDIRNCPDIEVEQDTTRKAHTREGLAGYVHSLGHSATFARLR